VTNRSVSLAPVGQHDDHWAFAKPFIEAALRAVPPMETLVDIERKIGSGHYQLWLAGNSAAITSVDIYPQKKVLSVVHGGGNLGELVDQLEPTLCAHAVALGCSSIMGTGRKGWERPLLSRGYEFAWITMHKDLHNGR
jgi:hypothetical protein